jgi:hypothetical protein
LDERIDNHHLCSTDEKLINAHLYLLASDVVARMCLKSNKSIETGVIHLFHPNAIWELTELLDRLARFIIRHAVPASSIASRSQYRSMPPS